jgi:predicted nucleic acid-binding protein
MKYLPDVNALLAWGHATHPHHARLHAWKAGKKASDLATCAISDLGFIRITAQAYGAHRGIGSAADGIFETRHRTFH